MDRKQNLYEALGVARDAGPHDIQRAWNKHRSLMRNETTPPDPRRDALMRHAYEVLSDEYRRAEYDASLGRESPVLAASSRHPVTATVIAALAIGGLGAAAYAVYWQQQPPPARTVAKSIDEIADIATRATGRLQSVDLGGRQATYGAAFAIEPGVMAGACGGLPPASEPQVLSPPRQWPARVTSVEAQGVCRLEVHGGAAFPLMLSGAIPRPGAAVYAVSVTPKGEAHVMEARVTRVGGGSVMSLETSMPVTDDMAGTPLLDGDGRVVGIAVKPEKAPGKYVLLPKRWLPVEDAPVVSPPRMREADAAPPARAADPQAVPQPPHARVPVEMSEDRKQRLRDAFQPPPKVPDDL